jgi:hypothetical protein
VNQCAYLMRSPAGWKGFLASGRIAGAQDLAGRLISEPRKSPRASTRGASSNPIAPYNSADDLGIVTCFVRRRNAASNEPVPNGE